VSPASPPLLARIISLPFFRNSLNCQSLPPPLLSFFLFFFVETKRRLVCPHCSLSKGISLAFRIFQNGFRTPCLRVRSPFPSSPSSFLPLFPSLMKEATSIPHFLFNPFAASSLAVSMRIVRKVVFFRSSSFFLAAEIEFRLHHCLFFSSIAPPRFLSRSSSPLIYKKFRCLFFFLFLLFSFPGATAPIHSPQTSPFLIQNGQKSRAKIYLRVYSLFPSFFIYGLFPSRQAVFSRSLLFLRRKLTITSRCRTRTSLPLVETPCRPLFFPLADSLFSYPLRAMGPFLTCFGGKLPPPFLFCPK